MSLWGPHTESENQTCCDICILLFVTVGMYEWMWERKRKERKTKGNLHGLCSNRITLLWFLPLYFDPSLCRCLFPLCKLFLTTVRHKYYYVRQNNIPIMTHKSINCLKCVKALTQDSCQHLLMLYWVTCQTRVLALVLKNNARQLAI